MRLPAAAASILAIGLVAAACGGDDATPEPTEEPTPAAAATEAAEEPAEEATEAPAEDPAEEAAEEPAEEPAEEAAEEPADEAAAEPEFGRRAATDSDADPATEFGLTSGRYRMQWQTTDCEQVEFLVSQVDGDFTFPWPSRSSFASATINDLPEGIYTIEQVDPGCTDWNVRVDWMTN
jgi:hypothetical protein